MKDAEVPTSSLGQTPMNAVCVISPAWRGRWWAVATAGGNSEDGERKRMT